MFQNKGYITITPQHYHERDNGQEMRAFDMGLIMINLTNPVQEVGMSASPSIWSRPMPLGKNVFPILCILLNNVFIQIKFEFFIAFNIYSINRLVFCGTMEKIHWK